MDGVSPLTWSLNRSAFLSVRAAILITRSLHRDNVSRAQLPKIKSFRLVLCGTVRTQSSLSSICLCLSRNILRTTIVSVLSGRRINYIMIGLIGALKPLSISGYVPLSQAGQRQLEPLSILFTPAASGYQACGCAAKL